MNILKTITAIFFLICSLYGQDTSPFSTIKIQGGATDIVLTKDKLYIATNSGRIDIFNQASHEYLSSVKIKKIKDFVGDLIESKIYSIDVIQNKLLIVAQGEKGGRNVFLYENNTLNTLISHKKRLFIAQAKFINNNQFVYTTLSNQLVLYDINQKKELYNKQISQSKFSNFALNKNKKSLIIADESGDLKVIDVQTSAIKTSLSNQNLDNVFQVDWKADVILTAGQDRRSVLYSSSNLQPYIRKSGFLIYGCALNQDGTLAAYSSDEQNNVIIYNTVTKKDHYVLTNNGMTITKILFDSNNNVYIGSDANVINYYKLFKE